MNGDYVVLTDKDFENANVEKTHTIDIIISLKKTRSIQCISKNLITLSRRNQELNLTRCS